MPNAFTAVSYDIRPDSLPLCTPATICSFAYNIAGNIHQDTTGNCALDSLSPGAPMTNMKVQLIENGQIVQQFYTFTSGDYSFKTDSLTAYTVTIDTTGLPLSIACPSAGVQNISLTPNDSVVTNVNFGMQCSTVDFGMLYIWGSHFRPTFTSHIQIGAGNLALLQYNADCGAGMSGTVTTTLSGFISYVGPAPGALTPSSVSGNVLTYNIADLDSLTQGSLDIIIMTDTNAAAGTDACITSVVTPMTPDINPNDDTLTQCFTIVHSWDPNSKSAVPSPILGGSGFWLTYTIDFQNTGTDTAYTVLVRDTLSQNVDASSFQYIASSNKAVIQLFGNAAVFTFPKINLVDSATSPALSQGWIQYKVKTKPLSTTFEVDNTAYIYFDNNPPIATNKTVNIIGVSGVTNLSTDNSSVNLYPNPNYGSLILQTSNSINREYIISDMLGNIIAQQPIKSNSQVIDMPDAADGVYMLEVKGAQQIRFVIMK